jgi:hypothetical protein
VFHPHAQRNPFRRDARQQRFFANSLLFSDRDRVFVLPALPRLSASAHDILTGL